MRKNAKSIRKISEEGNTYCILHAYLSRQRTVSQLTALSIATLSSDGSVVLALFFWAL